MVSAETIMALSAVAGTCIIGIGFVRTLMKNGKEQRDRDQELQEKQNERDRHLLYGYNAVIERLDDKQYGLKALKEDFEAQRRHCIEISSVISARSKKNEEEIDRLRDGR